MPKIRLVLTAAVALGLCAPVLRAAPPPGSRAGEASLDTLLGAIRANRKAFVAVNLKLTDAEAAKFWPLYDRYQKEVQAVGDRQVAVIQDYTANFGKFTNEKAMQLLEDYLATDADRI